MPATPMAVSLIFCDYVIVEQGTKKVSLIGNFSAMAVDAFPAEIPPFFAYLMLSDGIGDVRINVMGWSLESNHQVFEESIVINFPDKLTELLIPFQIDDLTIPKQGEYVFSVTVDDELITQRTIEFFMKGDSQ